MTRTDPVPSSTLEPSVPRSPRPVAHAVLTALLVALVACGGSDDPTDASATTASSAPESTAEGARAGDGGTDDTEEVAPSPDGAVLRILVTNDDGYDAEGLDSVVEALAGLDDVELDVVAPADQQSGQGGRRTEGDLETTEQETLGGVPVTAVEGFPADAVRVAIDELGLEPHLVVSGNNEGQNVGPAVDVSGTIGAARAGVARGVPALALSQGVGDPFDYGAAVPLLMDWITEQRDALLDGSAPVRVTSINIPSCDDGELKGLLEAEVEADRGFADAIGAQDCTSDEQLESGVGDVTALLAGYATIAVVPDEPATPPDVFDPSGEPLP